MDSRQKMLGMTEEGHSTFLKKLPGHTPIHPALPSTPPSFFPCDISQDRLARFRELPFFMSLIFLRKRANSLFLLIFFIQW